MEYKKQTVTVIAAISGVVIFTSIGLGGLTAAASDRDTESPASQKGLLNENQVDGAWSRQALKFPQPLPLGEQFSEVAPLFFHPTKEDPKENHFFEESLIPTMLTTYWRCSWLSEYVESSNRGDDKTAETALAALAKYGSVPGNYAADQGFQAYQAWLVEEATLRGTTPESLEFQNDCSIIAENGDKQ